MKKLIKLLLSFVLVFGVFLLTSSTIKPKAANTYFNSKYYTETAPDDYYATVDLTKSPEEIQKTLYNIISTGFVHYTYKQINEIDKHTDPDPNVQGNIICFYTGESLSSGWNKEHVWAKSHGFPNESAYPYSDAHHLRPTLQSINSSRSNSDFGEVKGTAGAKTDGKGNYWTSNTFEPRDEVKGDVARIMFYMETRYGNDPQYKLKLVNDSNTSGSTGNGRFGGLQTLIKWHNEDPVSKEEIYRNNVIYDEYQHNRNPFIDHPEYVTAIYGGGVEVTVDEAKVKACVDKINTIPATVALTDESLVNECLNLYNALNYKEKEKVTNYATLTSAVTAINKLKGTGGDTTTGGNTYDVKFQSFNYTTNKELVFGNEKFMMSTAGGYDGEIRLGANSKGTKAIPSKFGVSGKGAALEMEFDVENALTFEVKSSKEYQVDNWCIVFSEDGGSTWTKVKDGKGSDGSSNTYSCELSKPTTGRFALIIYGANAPRSAITQITVGAGTGEVNVSLAKVTTNASLSINYEIKKNVLDNASVKLNIIGHINAINYTTEAEYGILYRKAVEEGNIDDAYEDGDINTYAQSINGTYVKADVTVKDGEIIVKKALDLVINEEYEFIIVCTYNDKVYFGNPSKYGIKIMITNYLATETDARKKEVYEFLIK